MSGPPQGFWARFCRARAAVIALAGLIALGVVALAADLLASDLPLAVQVDGRLHLLPSLSRPAALRDATVLTLRERLRTQPAGWMVEPPVPYGPFQTFATAASRAETPPWRPDREHLLGTDELGRDVLARLIHGARVSLAVGVVAALLYALIGTLLGLLAGWFGGWVDAVISRLVEVMMTFPTLFFLLAVMGLFRVQSVVPVMLVIGLTRWPEVARLVRGETLRIKTLEFITASRALGASDARIIVRHLLPHALGPVLVAATFGVAGAIVLESALSFLGFGAPPPAASWGELLTQAHRYLSHPGAWWLTVFPGLALFGTVAALNLVGQRLRDVLDPRVRD